MIYMEPILSSAYLNEKIRYNLSLRWPKWCYLDMSEFVFLHTQLEKVGYKTKQPETRNPFRSVSVVPPTFVKNQLSQKHRGLHLVYLLL